jgi:hypothetical protein
VAAAYLLVVQTLVAGIALGTRAGFFKLDAEAHVICSSVGASSSPRGPEQPTDPDRSEHQICCILGCAMGGPIAGPPPATFAISGVQVAAAIVARSQSDDRIDITLERSPRKTRAPPRAA